MEARREGKETRESILYCLIIFGFRKHNRGDKGATGKQRAARGEPGWSGWFFFFSILLLLALSVFIVWNTFMVYIVQHIGLVVVSVCSCSRVMTGTYRLRAAAATTRSGGGRNINSGGVVQLR